MPVLAQILFLASSVLVNSPQIENAVTIHTATRDYLQFDIAPMSPCRRLSVTGLSLQSARTAVVQWSLVGTVVDTTCAEKTTRANIILPFPDSVGGPHGQVLVDSIVNAWGPAVTKIGRVENPAPPTMCPMVKCAAPDSAAAFKTVQTRLAASSFVAAFSPYYLESFAPVSPWSKTAGQENFPDVAVPLPGNAGNWIDPDFVDLAMDSLVSGKLTSPCTTGDVCVAMVVNPNVRILTGPVQYFYQQPTDPFRSDTSGRDNAFVLDTVLKMGSRLHLSGFIGHPCGRTEVDSQVIKETRWLVASNASLGDSLKAAFQIPGYCSMARPGAWPLRDGKVEVTSGAWVSLSDLIGVSGVASANATARIASVRRVGQSANLTLSAPACIRAIDISGREVMPFTSFAAGRHSLRLPGRGMLFVQVRSGMSTTTFPLEPAP